MGFQLIISRISTQGGCDVSLLTDKSAKLLWVCWNHFCRGDQTGTIFSKPKWQRCGPAKFKWITVMSHQGLYNAGFWITHRTKVTVRWPCPVFNGVFTQLIISTMRPGTSKPFKRLRSSYCTFWQNKFFISFYNFCRKQKKFNIKKSILWGTTSIRCVKWLCSAFMQGHLWLYSVYIPFTVYVQTKSVTYCNHSH